MLAPLKIMKLKLTVKMKMFQHKKFLRLLIQIKCMLVFSPQVNSRSQALSRRCANPPKLWCLSRSGLTLTRSLYLPQSLTPLWSLLPIARSAQLSHFTRYGLLRMARLKRKLQREPSQRWSTHNQGGSYSQRRPKSFMSSSSPRISETLTKCFNLKLWVPSSHLMCHWTQCASSLQSTQTTKMSSWLRKSQDLHKLQILTSLNASLFLRAFLTLVLF